MRSPNPTMRVSARDDEPTIPTLPPELLAYIIQLAQPRRYISHKVLRIEMTASHVSGYWRAVVLGEPRLWTHIDIHSSRSMKRIEKYLQRSGPILLLDVDIDIYRYNKALLTTNSLSKFQTVVGTFIVQNIHRIRSLSCVCYDKQTLINIMNFSSRSGAPSLQRLTMKYDNTSDTNPRPNNRSTPVLIAGAPALSYLESDMIDTRSNLDAFRHLTTLDLHLARGSTRHTYDSFVELLKAPRSLLYLSIEGCIDTNSWPLHSSGPHFELKKLKGLRLIEHGMMAAKFLLSVSAPQLESLWLDCSFDNFNFLIDAPQMVVVNGRPKFPGLKYLTIVNDFLALSLQLSKIFPTISHLHFPHAFFSAMGSLDKALDSGWASMDTLAFTMFRQPRSNKSRINGVLDAILVQRRDQGRPIRRLLVDKDHYLEIMKTSSGIPANVQLEVITTANYDEHWWNKVDKLGF